MDFEGVKVDVKDGAAESGAARLALGHFAFCRSLSLCGPLLCAGARLTVELARVCLDLLDGAARKIVCNLVPGAGAKVFDGKEEEGVLGPRPHLRLVRVVIFGDGVEISWRVDVLDKRGPEQRLGWAFRIAAGKNVDNIDISACPVERLVRLCRRRDNLARGDAFLARVVLLPVRGDLRRVPRPHVLGGDGSPVSAAKDLQSDDEEDVLV